jgi:hypothetical protein
VPATRCNSVVAGSRRKVPGLPRSRERSHGNFPRRQERPRERLGVGYIVMADPAGDESSLD